jgi:hypothetical protein
MYKGGYLWKKRATQLWKKIVSFTHGYLTILAFMFFNAKTLGYLFDNQTFVVFSTLA